MFAGIIASEDNINVTVTLPSSHTMRFPVTWNGLEYREGDTVSVALQAYETFQLQCNVHGTSLRGVRVQSLPGWRVKF
jgi:hypothetical protein